MKMSLKDIKVKKRLRDDIGGIDQLKESIQAVGLIHPIIINEKNELVSGYRRYEACRQLGFEEVEVRKMKTASDKVQQLDIEYHENLGRAELTEAESTAYNKKRAEILSPEGGANRFWLWLKQLWLRIITLFRRK